MYNQDPMALAMNQPPQTPATATPPSGQAFGTNMVIQAMMHAMNAGKAPQSSFSPARPQVMPEQPGVFQVQPQVRQR